MGAYAVYKPECQPTNQSMRERKLPKPNAPVFATCCAHLWAHILPSLCVPGRASCRIVRYCLPDPPDDPFCLHHLDTSAHLLALLFGAQLVLICGHTFYLVCAPQVERVVASSVIVCPTHSTHFAYITLILLHVYRHLSLTLSLCSSVGTYSIQSACPRSSELRYRSLLSARLISPTSP
jgi:hypothetical protein